MIKRVIPEEYPNFYASLQDHLGQTYAELPTGDRQENFRLAIVCYEKALRFWKPEEKPIEYARTVRHLGDAYQTFSPDNHNINIAIELYKIALNFQTREVDPVGYAILQNSLGNAYRKMLDGDRAAHLNQAIACYQAALPVYTSTDYPFYYAGIQVHLGLSYTDLPTGNRAENLNQAIQCFTEALRFFTAEQQPINYATVQNNLGNAYLALPSSGHDSNVRQAIACYQEALRFWTLESAPFDYTMVQNNLGAAYRALLTGNRDANLKQAIECYQKALHVYTPENDPFNYAGIQNNLGQAYSELLAGNRTDNLKQAIGYYQEALRFRTAEVAPLEYAALQHDLGLAHSQLPTAEHNENLQQAIHCYQEALRYRTLETAPYEFAKTQTDLGVAYFELPTGERGHNLAKAKACFEQALQVVTFENAPLFYARIQIHLGNVYANLPTGDREVNLKKAIFCYQQALKYLLPESSPLDYAVIQNDLGNAYSNLVGEDWQENLAKAIACFKEALRFYTLDVSPLDYAMTQNNLGAAYSDFFKGSRSDNLQQALKCYHEALRVWTPEMAPFDYAVTHNNIAAVYVELPTDELQPHLKQAIYHAQEALRFQSPETDPLQYAASLNNLGQAYQKLTVYQKEPYLAQAIECYQEARHYYTLELAPSEYRIISRNIANLYFSNQNWQLALKAYQEAIAAGEYAYQAGLFSESKALEVAINVQLHSNASFAAVRLNKIEQALLILEQGKTRLLNEALRMRISRPLSVPDDIWATFEQAATLVKALPSVHARLQHQKTHLLHTYTEYEQQVQERYSALDKTIQKIREYLPKFLKPIDLKTVKNILPDERTALIAFCITESGSVGFIITQKFGIQSVDVPDFTTTSLRVLTQGADDNPDWGGWIKYYNNKDETLWHTIIENTLAELGKKLLSPILARCPAPTTQLIFLPSGRLFLFPLHAINISTEPLKRVCDHYQVTYAPSLEVLLGCHEKAKRPVNNNFYAVLNPTQDLAYATIEGNAIAGFFTQSQMDTEQMGTKQAVITGVECRSYVHFSCHGYYNLNKPTLSGLNLADSRLTLAELQSDRVNLSDARLVTLSACETGLTDVFKGSPDEFIGLPAGFMLAGVPCVVSSLWPVPELSTALFMERFYANHLNNGMDFAKALHEAQRWVCTLPAKQVAIYAEHAYQQSANSQYEANLFQDWRYYRHLATHQPTTRPFEHPYYWAAFTVYGM
ncbi:MAG: hypothetical protein DRR19_00925 [Candidatus Parabeggiatoa sp. nov. 1]|nr:MAG: hypothetical protein DRR19_00925 [Gammaproteobacteria bacterium]